MQHYTPFLLWIDHQKDHMVELVTKWSNINTHPTNLSGLELQMQELKKGFEVLEGQYEELKLPPYTSIDDHGNKVSVNLGKALKITKRPKAPIQLFFAGHMDTVFTKNSTFQSVKAQEAKLFGPGVCDMKGGLVVLLKALQALEKSPYAEKIGWQVLINPDEEIGSPGSKGLFEEAATQHHLGLIFEPAHSDGAIVTTRAGAMKLTIVVRGKAAHAGRDFAKGRSALFAAANLVVDIEKLNTLTPAGANDTPEDVLGDHVIVNVGELHSGSGFNIVPDLAIIKINIRSGNADKMQEMKGKIEELVKKHSLRDGIWMEIHASHTVLPKVVNQGAERLIDWLTSCANDLKITLKGRPSRGVCDGNTLAAGGLATVDTLGPIGGNIHTYDEFVLIDSLPQRAKLCALLLMRLGNGEYVLESPHSTIQL